MNSDRAAHRGARGLDRRIDFVGQPTAVRVAQTNQVDTGLIHGLDAGERVFRVREIAVEEMFRIEDYFIDPPFEECDGVVEYLEVRIARDSQRLAHMKVPGLS